MKRSLKWIFTGVIALYLVSWMIVVPVVNSDLMQTPENCLGEADKIYTPKPSGLELLKPEISYYSKVDMHIYIKHPYQSEHDLETSVYLIAPFYAKFEYNFWSESFTCGGSGTAYLWWDGIRIVREFVGIT
ncbi:hypothetical protein MIB92_14990 [Aestuariirhabdus sp. Z084]|uniref:hypothetical protein n=1 Tax=Aestuariirhabdus haliotis TaxID=2918751 RepID=UPI00201B4392|nr:hypothetical protein [Aestuariirhabdus haliotis]MCL6416965.1 hypothetical protein [Aestuariirhabdus haliotis]MCL6421028.1 hypothetical protein [Aestuariirhabdus haliotis]